MQFNNPEVLYALFLLVIPVIVHLFQLRKFQRENFTNVKFLKRLSRQTRKSSRLKKWLVLATRLLLLASIILAFSRPYFPDALEETGEVDTFIYLDNSYSMQATGQRGRLLERSVQELLENLPADKSFNLMTNDETFPDVTRADLQEISYSAQDLDFRTVLMRAENFFSNRLPSNKKLLLISDFQQELPDPEGIFNNNVSVYSLPLGPQSVNNISLDSVYYSSTQATSGKIGVTVSYTGNDPGNVPVSLFSEEQLIGKTSVNFSEGVQQEIEFPVEINEIANGKVQIEDNGIEFDNTLFFTLNRNNPIRVTSINGSDDQFLKRIFQSPEFEFAGMPLSEIDYNSIVDSRVVILNEVEDLPPSLSGSLQEKSENNTVFIVIPGLENLGSNLRSFLNTLGFSGIGGIRSGERLVTQISFQHPLFSEVFEEQIRNFEYPQVQNSYNVIGNYSSILSFEDNTPFLSETGGNFLFTAPLNRNNSNFTQSPLIVPTFYNMGLSALKPTQLYYLLGETNRIEVPVDLQSDRILSISSATTNFIPQQQSFAGKVELVTDELPEQPGNFKILNEEDEIMGISFNVPRQESSMEYTEIRNKERVQELNDLQDFFSSPGFSKETDSLWKWFVIFALLFLITETLLLKYLK